MGPRQGPASLSQGMAETWRIFGTLLKNSPVDAWAKAAGSFLRDERFRCCFFGRGHVDDVDF